MPRDQEDIQYATSRAIPDVSQGVCRTLKNAQYQGAYGLRRMKVEL